MPIIKSAIKKAKQDIKAREHNRLLKDDFRMAVKKVKKLVQGGEVKKAQASLSEAYSKIDKAAKRKVLHKNNAARRKSRLSALLKKDTPKKEKKTTKK